MSGLLTEISEKPAAVQKDGDRTIIYQFHLHVGTENAGPGVRILTFTHFHE